MKTLTRRQVPSYKQPESHHPRTDESKANFSIMVVGGQNPLVYPSQAFETFFCDLLYNSGLLKRHSKGICCLFFLTVGFCSKANPSETMGHPKKNSPFAGQEVAVLIGEGVPLPKRCRNGGKFL